MFGLHSGSVGSDMRSSVHETARSSVIVHGGKKKWVDYSKGRKAPCNPVTQEILLQPLVRSKDPADFISYRKYVPLKDRSFALSERLMSRWWQKDLRKYKDYVNEFDSYVPKRLFDNQYLAKWVQDIRKLRAEKRLHRYMVEALVELNFPWEEIEQEEDWWNHFHNGVRYYYSLTGCTGHIPENFRNPEYPDIEAAAPWLRKQREIFWWRTDTEMRTYSIKAKLLMRHAVPMKTITGRVGAYANVHPERFLLKDAPPRPKRKKFAPEEVIQMMEEDPFAKYKRDKYLKMLTGS